MIESVSFSIAVDLTGMLALIFMLLSSTDRQLKGDVQNRRFTHIFVSLIFILLFDLITCVLHGRAEALTLLYAANAASFTMSSMLMLVFCAYLRTELKLRPEQWRIATWVIYCTHIPMMAMLLLNPVHQMFFRFDEQTGLPERGPLFLLQIGMLTVALMVCLLEILCCREIPMSKRMPLICFCMFPTVGGGMQLVRSDLSLTGMALLIACLILFSSRYYERNREANRKEMELENARAALVLSQIQPHFLFNSMTAVMDLCGSDPMEAKAALQELSDYLHYKITAMSHSYVVPFREDMEYLNNYLKLEKRRFGDRLRVEFDIGCEDFQIPLLTMQPLAENAIRHGISKKQCGGTIRICTREQPESYSILVEDDGVGFDASQGFDMTPDHVGLSNVRKRLDALCGGTITLHSTPGEGTRVEITIKKEMQS